MSFVIGQRIAMRQSARIKERLREAAGDRPTVEGQPYASFPRPERLLELREIAGVSAQKVTWLHGIARAALDGRLGTERLRSMSRDAAEEALRALPGFGPWTAEAIRLRGCGARTIAEAWRAHSRALTTGSVRCSGRTAPGTRRRRGTARPRPRPRSGRRRAIRR